MQRRNDCGNVVVRLSHRVTSINFYVRMCVRGASVPGRLVDADDTMACSRHVYRVRSRVACIRTAKMALWRRS